MQYDRNDEITYDEEFVSTSKTEYYNSSDAFTETQDKDNKKDSIEKSYPVVLIVQLAVCVLCALFFLCAKTYFPDVYKSVMDKAESMINDSLILDGNNIEDYFVSDD